MLWALSKGLEVRHYQLGAARAGLTKSVWSKNRGSEARKTSSFSDEGRTASNDSSNKFELLSYLAIRYSTLARAACTMCTSPRLVAGLPVTLQQRVPRHAPYSDLSHAMSNACKFVLMKADPNTNDYLPTWGAAYGRSHRWSQLLKCLSVPQCQQST